MPFYIVCQVSGKYHTSLTAHVFISNVYSIHLAFRQVSGSFSSGSRQILIIDYNEQFSGETTSFSTRNVVLKLQLRLRNEWRRSFKSLFTLHLSNVRMMVFSDLLYLKGWVGVCAVVPLKCAAAME